MGKQALKLRNSKQRQRRIRSTVIGTPERPRLAVKVTNLHITAQLIDDSTHKTLAYVTTVGKKGLKGTMTEKATTIGEEIATAGKAIKVKKVVFDRGGKLYHGRVAALADAARKSGLEF